MGEAASLAVAGLVVGLLARVVSPAPLAVVPLAAAAAVALGLVLGAGFWSYVAASLAAAAVVVAAARLRRLV